MKLFPLNESIPYFRESIQFSIIEEENALVVYDSEQYIDEPLYFGSQIVEILELINGEKTIVEIHSFLRYTNEIDITLQDVQSVISLLDEKGLFESESFFHIQQLQDSEFHLATTRKPVCSGSSYPEEKDHLLEYLDSVFHSTEIYEPIQSVAALIPHIDFRVGIEPYISAYKHIKDVKASVFFVIGTSHYGYQDQYILTEKDFETPLGTVQTNKTIVQKIHSLTANIFTKNDIAHKPEHSIEFHTVLLKYLFPDRDFTIVPILVTSFHHFVSSNIFPDASDRIKIFCETLKEIIRELGENAYVISSGDLSHIGLKFGDDFDAYSMKEQVSEFDLKILDSLVDGNKQQFFQIIKNENDRFRICGLPPTYTLLNSMDALKGKTIALQQWYEEETKSMVSFGSVLFQKD